MSLAGAPRLAGQDGRSRRTLSREDLLARREDLLSQESSAERSKALRRIRGQLRGIDCRSPRYGD